MRPFCVTFCAVAPGKCHVAPAAALHSGAAGLGSGRFLAECRTFPCLRSSFPCRVFEPTPLPVLETAGDSCLTPDSITGQKLPGPSTPGHLAEPPGPPLCGGAAWSCVSVGRAVAQPGRSCTPASVRSGARFPPGKHRRFPPRFYQKPWNPPTRTDTATWTCVDSQQPRSGRSPAVPRAGGRSGRAVSGQRSPAWREERTNHHAPFTEGSQTRAQRRRPVLRAPGTVPWRRRNYQNPQNGCVGVGGRGVVGKRIGYSGAQRNFGGDRTFCVLSVAVT